MKQGWQLKRLGEVCKTSSGGTPLKDKIEYYNSGNIPFLRSGEVCRKYIYKTEMFITELGLANSSAKLFPVDTVLIAMYGATAGQVGILKIESTTNQAVCGILPCKEVLSEFIYYFFLFYKDELVKQAVGGAQPNISQFKIKGTVIPLPPLSEQQRIVEKLNQVFAKIEKLRKTAEENLRNVNDLFQAALLHEQTPTQDWVNKSINEISKDIFAGGDAPQNNFSHEKTEKYDIPIYANAVKNDGLYGFTDLPRVIEPSLTIAARGSGTGYVLERTEAYLPIVRLIVVIPKQDQILLRYLYYLLRELNITKSGSAIPQLTVPMIKNYTVSFPPLPSQQRIVEKLDAISDRCRQMEDNYKQMISLCDDLKQSLLRKAFDGEL